jgi:hypothetical protein
MIPVTNSPDLVPKFRAVEHEISDQAGHDRVDQEQRNRSHIILGDRVEALRKWRHRLRISDL